MLLVRFLIVLWLVAGSAVAATPAAVNGTLALDGADILAAPVALHGNWRFFPERWVAPEQLGAAAAGATRIQVPGVWGPANAAQGNSGYGTGTYWLQLQIATAPTEPLALRFQRLCGASAIYFFRAGASAVQPLLYRGRMAHGPAAEIVAGSDTLATLPALEPGLYNLLVQHSNHHYHAGGICGPVSLGTASAQNHAHTVQLVKHVVAITLLLALALGALVLSSQNAERATPWLALVCVAIGALIATSTGTVDALIPPDSQWPQQWQYSLAYIALAWIPTALLMLYWQTFEMHLPRALIAVNLGLTAAVSLALLVLPAAVFTPHTELLAGLCCLQLLLGVAVVVAAVRRRRRYALLVLISIAPILISLPYDFYRYYYRGDTALLSPYTLAFLIAVHSWIYTLKFGGAYQLAARLSAHLQEEVELRTRELRDKNSKLELAQAALQKANEALKLLSITDGLTQVYNRMHFEQQFEVEWRRCARQGLPLSVLMIDADHFKRLNDSAGHLAGDQCLQAIAAELERHFKRAGELAARYGGEEFIVLLPDTNQNKALAVAEGFRIAVEKLTIEHAGKPYRVTVSIGVSTTVPAVDQPAAQLLATADAALYEAKDCGRNRVHSIPLLGQRRSNGQQQLRL